MTEQINTPQAAATSPGGAANGDTMLQVTGLVRHFPVTRGIIFRKKVGAVRAVDGIDMRHPPSGCRSALERSGAMVRPDWCSEQIQNCGC